MKYRYFAGSTQRFLQLLVLESKLAKWYSEQWPNGRPGPNTSHKAFQAYRIMSRISKRLNPPLSRIPYGYEV